MAREGELFTSVGCVPAVVAVDAKLLDGFAVVAAPVVRDNCRKGGNVRASRSDLVITGPMGRTLFRAKVGAASGGEVTDV